MNDLYAKLYEIGTPVSDASSYPGQQERADTCAIRAQQQILKIYGIEKSETELVADAIQHGEYEEGCGGTKLNDIGNLLVREGIEVNKFYGATPAHLIAELAKGHKIIAGVDSGEIWAENFIDHFKENIEDYFKHEIADHAIVVTGIDPYTYDVTISDPGDGNAMRTIPSDIFFNAFKDSGNYMVSTAFAPEDFIPIEDSSVLINHFFSMDEFIKMTQQTQTEIVHASYLNGEYIYTSVSAPQFLENVGNGSENLFYGMTSKEVAIFAPVINPVAVQKPENISNNIYKKEYIMKGKNYMFDSGRLAGSIISALASMHVAKKSRQLQESLSKEQMRQQKDMALKQMEISKEQIKLQREIYENNCRLKAAIAEKNLKQQMELSYENRELQKQLALFNANMQRETALLNTKEGIEDKFSVDNFPLFIRNSSYTNATEDITRKVKIIFSPPKEDVYEGSDRLMTSWMTYFLKENIPGNLYEYLGSAWRNDQFQAQSAYRNIFNEFHNQPFLILDCDILRDSFNFRICFWAPGSEDYQVQQIITDFKTSNLLLESARKRAMAWRKEVYERMIENGKTKEELRILFPEEMNNENCLEKEEELQKIASHYSISQYSFSQEDYNYCIEMIFQLSAISVGIFLDMYHMAIGNISSPVMLKRFSSLIDKFPDSLQCNMKHQVEEWVINGYIDFAEQLEKLQKENTHSFVLPGDFSAAMVNCRTGIIKVLFQLSRDTEARQFLEETNKKWCECIMGIRKEQLFQKLEKKDFFDFIVQAMLTDRELTSEMDDLCELNNKIGIEDFKPIKQLLTAYQKKLMFIN